MPFQRSRMKMVKKQKASDVISDPSQDDMLILQTVTAGGTDLEAFEDNLSATTNGNGASLVGIEDAGGYFTGTDVEAALQELGGSDVLNSTILAAIDTAGQQSAISDPSGGATIDAEARTAIASILTALETLGLIDT